MREHKATFAEFLTANQVTTSINLLRNGVLGQAPRISGLVNVAKLVLEGGDDVREMDSLHLVWYKPNLNSEYGWDKPGSQNYTVDEVARNRGLTGIPDTSTLETSLQAGLTNNISILVAHDTTFDKRVIVDGCKRAVALRRLIETGWNFPPPTHTIQLLELVSKCAHVFYPCDFLAFAEG